MGQGRRQYWGLGYRCEFSSSFYLGHQLWRPGPPPLSKHWLLIPKGCATDLLRLAFQSVPQNPIVVIVTVIRLEMECLPGPWDTVAPTLGLYMKQVLISAPMESKGCPPSNKATLKKTCIGSTSLKPDVARCVWRFPDCTVMRGRITHSLPSATVTLLWQQLVAP